jgi:hypothetical protein
MFEAKPEAVFYETQICIHFEKDYFHWVTARALKDLREGNKIGLQRFASWSSNSQTRPLLARSALKGNYW